MCPLFSCGDRPTLSSPTCTCATSPNGSRRPRFTGSSGPAISLRKTPISGRRSTAGSPSSAMVGLRSNHQPADRPPLWAALEARSSDDGIAIVEMGSDGPDAAVTFRELDADVKRVAAGLVEFGVEQGRPGRAAGAAGHRCCRLRLRVLEDWGGGCRCRCRAGAARHEPSVEEREPEVPHRDTASPGRSTCHAVARDPHCCITGAGRTRPSPRRSGHARRPARPRHRSTCRHLRRGRWMQRRSGSPREQRVRPRVSAIVTTSFRLSAMR